MSAEPAHYAVSETNSKGRVHRESAHPYRNLFERDRDRIIHCSAFRRLEGKTQVFEASLGDYYRTRLTHSIEVAQIGRTIAKALQLNVDLTEAICLAHDLGHSPFGHAGEKVLNSLMTEFGGFEHNRQSLRIVELLEHPYPDFAGLNLMYETRLALARHRTPYDITTNQSFDEVNCSLEGQVANLADRIAVGSHDLEDGMRAKVIPENLLKELHMYGAAQSLAHTGRIRDRTARRTRTAKAIIDVLVGDCINATRDAIANADVRSLADVYASAEDLVVLSQRREAELAELEAFLLQKFYQHRSLLEEARQAEKRLKRIFEHLCRRPENMPKYFQNLAGTEGLERAVCDYVAGMTDRFCLKMLDQIAEK